MDPLTYLYGYINSNINEFKKIDYQDHYEYRIADYY